MDRRGFLKNAAMVTGGLSLAGCGFSQKSSSVAVPSYLKDYEAAYKTDPHQAALEWFSEARFGLVGRGLQINGNNVLGQSRGQARFH